MIADRYEIDEAEKELFTQSVERLEPLIGLHVPKTDGDGIVAIEKNGTFRLDGMLIEISSSEIIDDTNERVSKGYTAQTTQEIALDGIRIVSTTYYTVDRYVDSPPRWEALSQTSDEMHDPSSEAPIILPDDYELEVESFWNSNPSKEEIEERYQRRVLEREESGSEQDVPDRFTKARLRRILPLLQQLGPEHILDARVW